MGSSQTKLSGLDSNAKVVLYGSGLFSTNNEDTNRKLIDQLKNSYFNTIIFWTLHIDDDGSLVYNNTSITKNETFAPTFNYLQVILNELVTSKNLNGEKFEIYFSIGSGGVGDFTKLQSFLSTDSGKLTVIRNFAAISSALPLTGFDLDDEDLFESGIISDITQIISFGGTFKVTFCPYCNESMWNDALQTIYQDDLNNNPQLNLIVSQYNLQCYSGGAFNSPLDWANSLPQNLFQTKINPQTIYQFIVPGYDASVMTPAQVQTQMIANYNSNPGLVNGFIWNSDFIISNILNQPDENLFLSYSEAILRIYDN
jgi:hypothetical protein